MVIESSFQGISHVVFFLVCTWCVSILEYLRLGCVGLKASSILRYPLGVLLLFDADGVFNDPLLLSVAVVP